MIHYWMHWWWLAPCIRCATLCTSNRFCCRAHYSWYTCGPWNVAIYCRATMSHTRSIRDIRVFAHALFSLSVRWCVVGTTLSDTKLQRKQAEPRERGRERERKKNELKRWKHTKTWLQTSNGKIRCSKRQQNREKNDQLDNKEMTFYWFSLELIMVKLAKALILVEIFSSFDCVFFFGHGWLWTNDWLTISSPSRNFCVMTRARQLVVPCKIQK